jgi:hypothetical protein
VKTQVCRQDPKVFKDYRVHKVCRESRDLLDYKVQQVYKVLQDCRVVQQDGQDPQVYKVFQEVRPIQAQQDGRGSQAQQVRLAYKDHKELQDLRVQQELQELLPIRAQRDLLDYKVLRVLEMQVEVQCRLLDRLDLRVS